MGKSGTGKSYQALSLCKDLNIESIIDDGLFIYHSQVVAGISAKRQSTTVGAIKTALFRLDDHRDKVVEAIKKIKPNSILIIGTSDRMVKKIITRLSLPSPEESNQIYIEDLTTEEERQMASKQRHVYGKHVIPVPTLQLKRDFAGYFIDPLQVFRDLSNNFPSISVPGFSSNTGRHKNRRKAVRRDLSVVRPTYSYAGEFFISDKVVSDIARCVGRKTIGVRNVGKVYGNTSIDALEITVHILVDRSVDPWSTALRFQEKLFDMIEQMTAFNVDNLRVEVKGIV